MSIDTYTLSSGETLRVATLYDPLGRGLLKIGVEKDGVEWRVSIDVLTRVPGAAGTPEDPYWKGGFYSYTRFLNRPLAGADFYPALIRGGLPKTYPDWVSELLGRTPALANSNIMEPWIRIEAPNE